MTSPITVTRTTFALDCPDAVALAEFYAALLGWEVSFDPDDDHWVEVQPPLGTPGSHFLAFQQVENYRAPEWPEGSVPQQAHLDFYVPDLESAASAAVAFGARRHEVQPSQSGSFIVFADPAGHLFCLCKESNLDA
ncbi:VOC family protein [Leucobacter sp. NPDC015123]|uniref:VOC family protein n=1 Tax=Leucobacter sp. NPDC015123 TaxID=3364129 RepID=UPI0036F4747D